MAGRGRGMGARGGPRAQFNNRANMRHNPDYPDYPTEYTQVIQQINKFAPTALQPFMGAVFFENMGYANLDDQTLMDYVRKQIEYYFSEENLMKDLFLRRKMDAEGFLPVTLIASFYRVRNLTIDLNRVLEAISTSDKLQLVGMKVRTRNDPKKWPLPDPVGNPFFVSGGGVQAQPIVATMHPLGAPMLSQPLQAVPPAPMPRRYQQIMFPQPRVPAPVYIPTENLNPDVPEFVPIVNGFDRDIECAEEATEDGVYGEEAERLKEEQSTPNVAHEAERLKATAGDGQKGGTQEESVTSGDTSSSVSRQGSAESEDNSCNKAETVSIPALKVNNITPTSPITEQEVWKEVKRKVKSRERADSYRSATGERERHDSVRSTRERTDSYREEREELDFQFDEELDVPSLTGRQKQFTDWSEDESDDYELSDHEINKLLIVTQTSYRAPKHEGYDRTGDWTSRVKMTQDLEQAINIGLQYYEENLWSEQEWFQPTSGSYKTVNIITQEDFAKLAPRSAPKRSNPEAPPPPPPPSLNTHARYMHDDDDELEEGEIRDDDDDDVLVDGKVSHDESKKAISVPSESSLKKPPKREQYDDKQRRYRDRPKFYAVVKDTRRPVDGLKRKTRHSDNPPVEHHVGWIMDVREHRPRTSSIGSSTGTSPNEGFLSGGTPQSLPHFQHPSHSLLKENNFTQQVYHKYHSRCLKGQYQNTSVHIIPIGLYEHRDDRHVVIFLYLWVDSKYFSYGLEKKFRPELYTDFQIETMRDYESGQLYGLEKFWAFLKYYKHSSKLCVDPRLKEYLSKFKTIEDFRVYEKSERMDGFAANRANLRGKGRNRSVSESSSWDMSVHGRQRRMSGGQGQPAQGQGQATQGQGQQVPRKRADSIGSGRTRSGSMGKQAASSKWYADFGGDLKNHDSNIHKSKPRVNFDLSCESWKQSKKEKRDIKPITKQPTVAPSATAAAPKNDTVATSTKTSATVAQKNDTVAKSSNASATVAAPKNDTVATSTKTSATAAAPKNAPVASTNTPATKNAPDAVAASVPSKEVKPVVESKETTPKDPPTNETSNAPTNTAEQSSH
ncbi:la-related protein 1B [Nilaparvata lugens]|uniref:la-related protein 1B n=1 Tax=Nilaparvata lugens TaxID=108931 RepID=UPI00193D9F59|nr:la-related protein 1B [Nilaparvata lugens]